MRFKFAKAFAFTFISTLSVVTAPAVVSPAATVHAAAVTLPAGASAYQAVAPLRLADTRPDYGAFGFTRISDRVVRVQVAGKGGVPSNAVAAVLNVTGVNTTAPGFITVYPAGTTLPTASNVNIDNPGRVMANMVTVKLGVDGAVDVFMMTRMDVVVDVSGAYAPTSVPVASGRLVTRADGAFRVLDTRQRGAGVGAGQTEAVDVAKAGVPADAIAVVVNITATETGVGFWTAFPVGQTRPNASNLNIDTAGQTRAGQAIVLLSPGSGLFNVFSMSGGHLIVDVAGWFTGSTVAASSDGLFVPTKPTRLLDSRSSFALPVWGGTTLEVPVGNPGTPASAVAINVTGTESMLAGFVTAFPAGVARPEASNLNLDTWDQTIANHAIVRASTRGISLFTQRGLHMIADLNGWYLGNPTNATLAAPTNPAFGPATAVKVQAPQIGLFTDVGTGTDLDAVANLGIAATWNGAAQLATPGNIVLFGHRTTHGAPFRIIDELPAGSMISLIGDDGHSYNYMVVRQDVTVPVFSTINAIAVNTAVATVQLVACTPPGSIRFRVVTTARLVGVT